jgi:hypothetical protein
VNPNSCTSEDRTAREDLVQHLIINSEDFKSSCVYLLKH